VNFVGQQVRPATSVETAPGRVVTTEATSKKWKAVQFAGFMISVIGIAMIMGGSGQRGFVGGGEVMVLGFMIFLFGRFMGWWKHG